MRYSELETKLKSHSTNIKKSIDAPFDITQIINETEKCNMTEKIVKTNWVKKTLYSAAAAAAAFVLTFNFVPTLTYAVSDVPVLGDVVRVVTFGRFEVKEENYEAKVATPKLEGFADKELENRLNEEFKENAEAVIIAFEADVKKLSEDYGDKNFYLSVDADYVVKTDNDDILALDFAITRTEASAASVHRFYNIDKKNGRLITLDSLFKEDADYVASVSEYIIAQMKEQNQKGEGAYFVDDDEPERFSEIKKDQNFYINNSGNLVICFDEYEVAAASQGSPEFEIPNHIIKDILK